jgi:hypothetical protein
MSDELALPPMVPISLGAQQLSTNWPNQTKKNGLSVLFFPNSPYPKIRWNINAKKDSKRFLLVFFLVMTSRGIEPRFTP